MQGQEAPIVIYSLTTSILLNRAFQNDYCKIGMTTPTSTDCAAAGPHRLVGWFNRVHGRPALTHLASKVTMMDKSPKSGSELISRPIWRCLIQRSPLPGAACLDGSRGRRETHR